MIERLCYLKINNLRFLNIIFCLFIVGCSMNEDTVSSNAINVEGNIYKLKGELFTGQVLDESKYGRVLKSFRCVEGKIEGEYLEYYSTGKIKQRRNFKNGLLDGVSELYNKDGILKLNQNYKKGVLEGYSKEENYYGSMEGHYKNGLQDGLWIYRYSNQKIKAKGRFEKGDKSNLGNKGIPRNGRVGEWLFYSEDGVLDTRHLYKINSEIVESISYYKSGKIHYKGTFNKREIDLETWKEFDENGKLVNSYP